MHSVPSDLPMNTLRLLAALAAQPTDWRLTHRAWSGLQSNWRFITMLLATILLGLLPPLCMGKEVDLVVERAWFEDQSGQMSWDQIREHPMTPFEGVLSLGYSDNAVWVRLRIDPSSIKAERANRLYRMRWRSGQLW